MKYKQKNYLLLSSAIIFFWLSWKLAIAETINLSVELEKMEVKQKSVETAPAQIAYLENELKKVKGNSTELHSSIYDLRKTLLSEISTLARKYNVLLKSFPEHFVQQFDNMELSTSKIVLEGGYIPLLSLIHEFEQKKNLGKISSFVFEVEESPRKKKRKLSVTLYVQSINL